MKPIPIPSKGQKCYRCHKNIFAFETPSGADYTNCPICGKPCECCTNQNYISDGEFC